MSSKALADGVDVGTVVANTYEIVSILGRGGMGTVWEAHHQRLPGKRVAIKVLHPSVSEDVDALARFRREAEIACRLGHPNIVEVHDFNSLDDGTPYLILELLEGESLDARLKKGSLSTDSCEHILRQVGSALQCAHEQGVVHRDLKPQNIFLVPSPSGVGPEIAKVLDFGISKIRGSQTVKTQESTLLGTPQYMSPEQATGQHDNVDARTDLFALAVMIYELISGRAAFAGQNIPEVVYKVVHVDATPINEYLPDLAPEKVAALEKAMSKDQADRYETVSAFVEAFTGSPLPETRTRLTPVPSELAEASTVASTKLALGSAATLDSQKMVTPAGTSASALANAATIDSAKMAKDQAFAETVDSSKIDRQSTLMAAQAALPVEPQTTLPVKTEVAEVSAPRSVQLRTMIIAMALMLSMAAAAWVVFGRGAEETGTAQGGSDQQELEAPHAGGTAVALAASDAAAEAVVLDTAPSEYANPAGAAESGAVEGTTKVGADSDSPREKVPPELPSKLIGKRVGGGTKASSTGRNTPRTRVPPPPPPEPVDPSKALAIKLLTHAKDLLKEGNNEEAITTAIDSYKLYKLPQSFKIRVQARCNKEDHSNANAAFRNIPARYKKMRKQLQSYCQARGIVLDMRLD